MTLKVAQLYDTCDISDWADGATNHAWVLCTEAYTPSEAHATYSQLTNVITAGDGAPIAITTRSKSKVGDVVQFHADPADFGASVTVSAKYLVAVKGNSASLQAADPLIFFIDLRAEDANPESSTNAPFKITAHSSGWFGINQPAA